MADRGEDARSGKSSSEGSEPSTEALPSAARDLGLTSFHVHRAKEGDPSSVEWIVARFTPLLLEQARYRIGPALRRRLEPEDLVQEVWGVALAELGGLGARDERETPVVLRFLSTTLLYRLNNHARKHIRSREVGALDAGGNEGSQGRAEPWEHVAARTRGQVTRIARGELHAEIARALDGLAERDREVVVLRGIEGHSNARVAELLGETPNAVSLRYNRALAALRAALPASVFDELG